MITAQRLFEISKDLEFEDLAKRASDLVKADDSDSCPLILPLVGEFSSGKTTLLNALTDSKALETATKPTTATIYEIHFGQESVAADVYQPDGTINRIEDLSLLKNEDLADADCVNLFDTSTKVPSSTILVDTPGLSAPNPRHKETLVRFLPMADGIILVADINQQITRSMLDFVKAMDLSGRRLFLVLTKTDTKAPEELAEVRKYAAERLELTQDAVVCVSAKTGDVNEFTDLLGRIAADKTSILKKVNAVRMKALAKEALSRISQMKAASKSNTELKDAIYAQKTELSRLDRAIEELSEEVKDSISKICRETTREFEDRISERLEEIVLGDSANYDNDARTAVNTTSELYVSRMRNDIRESIRKTMESYGDDKKIDFKAAMDVDLSQFAVSGLSYNLSLNDMGHEYDNGIALGIKVAAVAAVAVGVGALAAPVVGAAGAAGAGAAAGTGAAGVAGAIAKAAPKFVDAADTVSDVGSIIATRRMNARLDDVNKTLEELKNATDKVAKGAKTVDTASQTLGQMAGSRRGGLVEGMVGFVTDKTLGKPQRRRAIHEYVDNHLSPQFKLEVERNAKDVVSQVKESVKAAAREAIENMTTALEKLQKERETEEVAFNERMSKLNSCAAELDSII